MEALVKRLCDAMLARGIIEDDNYDICVYGLELLASNLLLFFAIGLIACLTGTFWVSAYFTALFCVLRFHLGGYHCKRYAACFVFSLCIYLAFLALHLLRVPALLALWVFAVAAAISGLFLLLRSLRAVPLQKRNAALSALYLAAALCFCAAQLSLLAFPIVFTMVIVSFLLLIEKGDLPHEQENF